MGNADAMEYVAWSITQNSYKNKVDPKLVELAMKYYKLLLNDGNTSAMLDFGGLYLSDSVTGKNREKALEYYERALELGDVKAYRCIGNYYLYDNEGDGTPVRTTDLERIKKAYEYYREGADHHEVNSLYELGDMYLAGKIVDKDVDKAFSLYVEAYENLEEDEFDDSEADILLRLGEAYCHGIGVEQEFEQAMNYLQRAYDLFRERAERGDKYAVPYVERAYKEWNNLLLALVGNMNEKVTEDTTSRLALVEHAGMDADGFIAKTKKFQNYEDVGEYISDIRKGIMIYYDFYNISRADTIISAYLESINDAFNRKEPAFKVIKHLGKMWSWEG